jgi:protein phosphatase
MRVSIPKLSLVVLIGPSGSGKSTFARKHFLPTEILSSDTCRGFVCDDENDQAVSKDAFDVLHYIAAKRLALGRLTVIDATNVQPESRQAFVQLARKFHCLPVAIVLNLPEQVCHQRNRLREDRAFGPHVVRQQRSQLRKSIRKLGREGFRHVFILNTPEDVDAATIERVPLYNDKRAERGPFDIIGDVHGCCDELEELLLRLGYVCSPAEQNSSYCHPDGRKAIFLGDLVDRGPRVLDTVSLVQRMIATGNAFCVPGNHDIKLLKKLQGKKVQVSYGLANTLAEIEALPVEGREQYCQQLAAFLDGLVSHYVLDEGKLVVAHAGLKEAMHGRGSGKVRSFALYGETTGETDEFGLPVRHNWAAEYRGSALVVYGHTPVPQPEWLNRTLNIDTGCVFGGSLTALRYPEKELVSVAAARTYCEPARPFLAAAQSGLTAQQLNDDVLDAIDVIGKRIIETQWRGNVTVREANASAALEVMSRFAANPKWLIYLPPTMSPCETSNVPGFLEHPAQAFAYFRSQEVTHVVCEAKHMGSRAVVIVCRDHSAAKQRFGVLENEAGIIYTRTGRRFFDDLALEAQLLERVRGALTATSFWESFESDWVCLDCELMPWSAKATELLRTQYAAVGAAAGAALPEAVRALEKAALRLSRPKRELVGGLAREFQSRRENAARFVSAYRQYCWPVDSIEGLKLAPFHLLATEGHVHTDKDHAWHLNQLAIICRADPGLLLETPSVTVDITNPADEASALDWWLQLTEAGGEGMVVKPLEYVSKSKRGLIQPAVKCRGREYLRIIYGPDYTNETNLARLRNRGLAGKRSLALAEFALGIEGLVRFVRREPLRRVHECVFGVLALESEPVDPRL